MSNYTDNMVAAIRSAAPLTLAKAKALASDFGTVSHRSVISKAKSLGVEYVKAAPAARKERGPTKADYLREIRTALALPEREGDFTKAELMTVLANIGLFRQSSAGSGRGAWHSPLLQSTPTRANWPRSVASLC